MGYKKKLFKVKRFNFDHLFRKLLFIFYIILYNLDLRMFRYLPKYRTKNTCLENPFLPCKSIHIHVNLILLAITYLNTKNTSAMFCSATN